MEKNQFPKWGSRNKMIFKPKWARWKLHLQISDNKWRTYFSYDYSNVYVNSIKTKMYIEEMALLDMIARIREKHPTGYKYGNVFANLSDDLSTEQKNFNHHVFTMTPTKCTWKQEIFYYSIPVPGSAYISKRVDVVKTLENWKHEQFDTGADNNRIKTVNGSNRKILYRILDETMKKQFSGIELTEIEAKKIVEDQLNKMKI